MGTLRRLVDRITSRFDKKQTKNFKFSTHARGPKENIVDEAMKAYKSYAGRMRKRGQRAKSFKKWLKDKPVGGYALSFGTFRPSEPLPGRTDFSHSADVHIARVKGNLPTRAEVRKRHKNTLTRSTL